MGVAQPNVRLPIITIPSTTHLCACSHLAALPHTQTFNFRFVSVDYQLLAVNAATVLESTFMCWYVPSTSAKRPSVCAHKSPPLAHRARAQDDWVAAALSAGKRLRDDMRNSGKGE